MIQIHVIEINQVDGMHIRYIRFDLDDGKDFCYRSRVSHDAFFHHYKKMRNRSDIFLYLSQRLEEFQSSVDIWTKMISENPELEDIYGPVPVVTVKNIWEFYKLIGYDYKTKKWSK